MKTILAALLLSVSLLAEEPKIPGTIMGSINGTIESNSFRVEWAVPKAQRPRAGSTISVEWGDGQYFAVVLKVKGTKITTDYHPISTIPEDPIVRLVR